MADKNITCKDCHNDFVFTQREQDFFAQKQFAEPKRCRDCRIKEKQRRGAHQGGEQR